MPPPVRGLNARDALASMDDADAVILDNWFPRGNDVQLRRGYEEWCTPFADPVETLMEYNGPAGRELFAAAGTDIYDVTVAVNGTQTSVVGSLTNARWQHTMMTTSGGTFLVAVNGEDAPVNYNGSAWSTSPAITGVTASELINVALHKRRLWFIQKDTASAWYLATDAIGGSATEFSLGSVWRLGGELKVIVPLSQDSGSGPDDFLAFISDKGEVAVYQGTDPASANTWALVGVFRIGAPIGDRAALRVGGDAAIITDDGVISLLKAMQFDRSAQRQASITDRIQPLFASYVRSGRTLFGWQGIAYPAGNWAVFNIPTSATGRVQLVMNTITGAWCRFTGWQANCFGLLGDDLFFGGPTYVVKADAGRSDGGAAIVGDVKTAFNYFRDRARLKSFKLLRPVLSTNGTPNPKIALNVDFKDELPTGVPSFTASGAQWDVAKWDAADWVGGDTISLNWTGVAGYGRCAAVRMRTSSTNATMALQAFDLIYDRAQGTAL